MESAASLITFLQQPASYAHCPASIEIKQTHGSILAIAPPYVYKIKKQVNLGFMDFTSLAARKTNCERELYLNSRLSPDLYLAVLPICRNDGKLAFGQDGEIIEYALQMRMLPEGYFLHQLLAKDQVSIQTLEPVLLLLKDFYQQQSPDSSIARYGEIQQIQRSTDENFTTLQHFAGDRLKGVALAVLEQYTHLFYGLHRDLFNKRVHENKIKDCHGDLHLEHIHIYQNIIHIYDCIEFNDRFRYIDIAADIAFLAMDLDFHQRPSLAAYVSSRMAALLQDQDMLKLMDFYKGYRACVRAKVEAIKSAEPEVAEKEKQQSREKAARYLQLAVGYAVVGSKPVVLIVCGRIGSGKSTLAQAMADLLGFSYVSSDVVRKEKAGIPLFERTPAETKQHMYSSATTDAVYKALLDTALSQAAMGLSVVVDATFGQPTYRQQFTNALKQKGISYYFIEAQAADAVIQQRLADREKRKNVVSDARLEDFSTLARTYQPLVEIPAEHLLQVSTEVDVDTALLKVCMEIVHKSIAG
ncbi:AAA family ATPase [Rhodocytophaga aerolata]|uniref:AAA family ATPase n=1 Tax=Rhodocytophaga aerolata TaxID=455078 RepID=A0ABT8R3N9_9BACT|nr:AAA family ATPase [Rhodocytophaga aerolata]MDO1446721.1 AAA family ATPase [Rhodocytophaga aerolata]